MGPLVGAAVIGAVPIYLSAYPGLDTYLYAGLLLVVVLVRPRGLLGRTGVRVSLPDPAPCAGWKRRRASPEIGTRDLLECVGVSVSFGSWRSTR